MRFHLQLFTAVLCVPAFAANLHEVQYQIPTPDGSSMDKGFLLVRAHGGVDLYGSDALPLRALTPQLPDSADEFVESAAADEDGSVTLALRYWKDHKQGGGFVLFDNTGKQTGFFNTGEYWPLEVAFGPDHSIWTLGMQAKGLHGSDDYPLLRNYAKDGQIIGAFLSRSSFKGEQEPIASRIGGEFQLRISNGIIGALFYFDKVQHPLEWIELDLRGKELGRWELGSEFAPKAFTASHRLYAQHEDKVFTFERATNAWRQVADVSDATLVNADEDNLVFHVRGTNTYRWLPAPQ